MILLLANAMAGAQFVDRAGEMGISFRHQTGASGQYYFPEITGAGAALFDVDNDGDLDAYLVQSGSLDDPELDRSDRLYRNALSDQGRFEDATDAMLPTGSGYGMGVAAGDVNGDGYLDLYITQFGEDRLLINRSGRRFEDITAESGISAPGWSTSASFLDADADGDLDLYVASYVVFDIASNPSCYAETSRRDYCGPADFAGQQDRFFLNDGTGRFRDATLAWLGNHEPQAGLGVIAVDFNADSWTDLYVANDGAPNHLWINQAGAGFKDEALLTGVAFNGAGRAEASMGIAVGDHDADGDWDLLLSHLMGESNTLYRNDGVRGFADITAQAGLGANSFPYTGWGTAFVDFDHDGWLDLLVFNGAVRTIERQVQAGAPYPFVEANQAWRSEAGKRFREVSNRMGADFQHPLSARGAAFGDIDNDGDTDVLVNNGNGPAQLLVATGAPQRWLGVTLEGPGAAGAAVGLETPKRPVAAAPSPRTGSIQDQGIAPAGGATPAGPIWRRAAADGSYASSSDPRAVFYPPASDDCCTLRVRWADGHATRHTFKPDDHYVSIKRKEDS